MAIRQVPIFVGALLGFLTVANPFGTAAQPAPQSSTIPNCRCWVPSAEDISKFEEQVLENNPVFVAQVENKLLKTLPSPLITYRRYYAGVFIDLEPVTIGPSGISKIGKIEATPEIKGVLLPIAPGEKSSVIISTDGKVPLLQSAGCLIRGYPTYKPPVRCSATGDWLPSEAQIEKLERLVQLPKGAESLKTYGRYYSGVTDQGRRLIKGRFILNGHYSVREGVFRVFNIDLPQGGNERADCVIVNISYSVSRNVVESTKCDVLDAR